MLNPPQNAFTAQVQPRGGGGGEGRMIEGSVYHGHGINHGLAVGGQGEGRGGDQAHTKAPNENDD